jgi:hypothetical protein
MKSVLKPTLLKVVITFGLFTVFSWSWRIYVMSTISDTFPLGFPMQFFLAWGSCQAGQNCSEFNGLYLTLDLIFWYIIGAILVSRFQKK